MGSSGLEVKGFRLRVIYFVKGPEGLDVIGLEWEKSWNPRKLAEAQAYSTFVFHVVLLNKSMYRVSDRNPKP